jgi:hypothetical protein
LPPKKKRREKKEKRNKKVNERLENRLKSVKEEFEKWRKTSKNVYSVIDPFVKPQRDSLLNPRTPNGLDLHYNPYIYRNYGLNFNSIYGTSRNSDMRKGIGPDLPNELKDRYDKHVETLKKNNIYCGYKEEIIYKILYYEHLVHSTPSPPDNISHMLYMALK